MKSIQIRKLTLGEGIPKICVPIVGKTEKEILAAAKEIAASPADIVEWRADFFEGLLEEDRVKEMLGKLRETLGEMPLLFTIRTKAEGGAFAGTKEQYVSCTGWAICSGFADAVDTELFQGEDTVQVILGKAHQAGVKVIGSNHDFAATPAKEEIIRRLRRMQELGMDVAKIAVMPQSAEDVLTLLSATEEMRTHYAKVPLITMSMGAQGVISRLAGEQFGSALTFGMIGKASAPGQIPAEELRMMLERLHKYSSAG